MTDRRIRSYSEMLQFDTFRDRFEYLKLGNGVAQETFGSERYLNQEFYRSQEWRTARRDAIARDYGCDLGVSGYEAFGRILVHHINPIDAEDIRIGSNLLFDPNNLVTVTHETHNAIHYGEFPASHLELVERSRGDTKLW